MKLYHYAPSENTFLTDGIRSFALGYGDVEPYVKRAGSDDRKDIIRWMERCFSGRSRAISCITEPIVWMGNDPMLKEFVEQKVLFSFDLKALADDGLIESVWCQTGEPQNQRYYPVKPDEIEVTPLPWHLCNRKKGLFFGIIRHYFVVPKKGFIPPKYLILEPTG